MKELAMSLVSPLMTKRLSCRSFGAELNFGLKRMLKLEEDAVPEQEKIFEIRNRCSFCPLRLG